MKRPDHRNTPWPLILWLLWCAGCTGHFLPPPRHPAIIHGDEFVIVTVSTRDELTGLARTHLGSTGKAYWITEYQPLSPIVPGQRLVIPLKPIVYGGLYANGHQTVPVLKYPNIGADGLPTKGLSAAAFEEHVEFLAENEYVTISLDQLYAFFALEDRLPPNAVVLTFDSPDKWVYEVAYPILKRHGHTAAFFVPAEAIGTDRSMDWSELAEMADSGFTIGVSGLRGLDLTRLPSAPHRDTYLKELEDEIRLARQILEDNLHRPCLYFAYPDGQTNDLIIALLKQYGYRGAFTLVPGPNAFDVNDFMVHRTVIDPATSTGQLHQWLTTFIASDLE